MQIGYECVKIKEKEVKVVNILKSNIIQSNDLIRNSQNKIDDKLVEIATQKASILSVNNKRIILYLISKIQPFDEELREVKINLYELCSILNIKPGGMQYRQIKNELLSLTCQGFCIETKEKVLFANWLDSNFTEIDINNNTITLKLSDRLKPFLLNLKENFTSFQLGYTLNFKGKYTYRLYEYLHSFENQRVYLFPIELFEEKICDNKYKSITDIERWVLNKAIKEINEFSDITISYRKIKTKRKTTHLYFEIDTKSDKEKEKIMSKWNFLNQGENINQQLEMDLVPTTESLKRKKQIKENLIQNNPDFKYLEENGLI